MESERSGEALAALAEVDEGHAAAARIARAPWWYYVVPGIGFGLWTVLLVTDEGLLRAIVGLVVIVVLSVLTPAYRLVTGTNPGGFRSGGIPLLWTIGVVVVVLGIWVPLIVTTWRHPGPLWLAVVAGVAVAAAFIGYGAGFERARRRG
jgi:hypothetical protein